MNKIELLAPAGNLEKLKFAYLYGADACYIGGRDFSLRANAKNFSVEEINEACSYAHNLGKRVYVTVNIVFHNEDINGIIDYLKELAKAKVDAIIVSDPLVIDIIKENNIDLEVHISTQASTLNYETVDFWKKEGASRVVLARELSKDEIKEKIELVWKLNVLFMVLCVLLILVDVFYLIILLIEMLIGVVVLKYVDGKCLYLIKIIMR